MDQKTLGGSLIMGKILTGEGQMREWGEKEKKPRCLAEHRICWNSKWPFCLEYKVSHKKFVEGKQDK